MTSNYPNSCEFDSDCCNLFFANTVKALVISVTKKVPFC